MSEIEPDGRLPARATIAKGMREYADAVDWASGGVVTGYVVLMEITTGDGVGGLWMTGNGREPTGADWEGLALIRCEGLLAWGLRRVRENGES